MGQGTRRCGWKLVDRVSGNPQQQHRDATSHPEAVMSAWQVGGQLAIRGGVVGWKLSWGSVGELGACLGAGCCSNDANCSVLWVN